MNAVRNLALRRVAAVAALNFSTNTRLVAGSSLKKCLAANRTLVPVRSFSQTSKMSSATIFNVQDEDDFQKRVIDNKKTVVVDFHAQ